MNSPLVSTSLWEWAWAPRLLCIHGKIPVPLFSGFSEIPLLSALNLLEEQALIYGAGPRPVLSAGFSSSMAPVHLSPRPSNPGDSQYAPWNHVAPCQLTSPQQLLGAVFAPAESGSFLEGLLHSGCSLPISQISRSAGGDGCFTHSSAMLLDYSPISQENQVFWSLSPGLPQSTLVAIFCCKNLQILSHPTSFIKSFLLALCHYLWY